MQLYDEAGEASCTMSDFTKSARLIVKHLDANGQSRSVQISIFKACMDDLALELYDAFGSAPYTMRDVRKLWRDEFVAKHERWFVDASTLLELGAIRNDEANGWLVIRRGEGVNYESAEQISDTCAHCGVMGSFKRCPCSKKVRYCGTACQNMHWADHTATHNAKLASTRARRARASAGFE